MSKKEDIFGKLNIKDYNNYLEEILETKDFSSDVKNLLLSMLYKVETAYNDYYIVKNLEKTKKEFVEEIVETIKNNCEKIELVRPSNEKYLELESKIEKCIVNKEKKEIISIYNERVLLYAISKLADNEYKFKNNILKKILSELLYNGKDISNKEIVRDFDGWAWHIETNQIENIEYNLVYQNILMLIGNDIKTEDQINERLKQIYTKQDAEKLYMLLCQIALIMYLNKYKNEKQSFSEEKTKIEEKLNEMNDEKKYLKEITEKIKKTEAKIKNIDKCLTDVVFLRKEYIKTNEKLKESEKIFSISDFEEKIQKEKAELICELDKYNKKMLKETYIKEKRQLSEQLEILEVANEQSNLYEYILELQRKFIKGLQEKIKKAQTRTEIMSIIYKLRYYKFLPYENMQIKNVKELKADIRKTEEILYNKAYKMNIINQISINEKVNNDVLIDILDTNIIELENIEILFYAENYQIKLKIFDEEIEEKILEYDTIEGLIVRMNKKIRLFIK